MKFAEVRLLVPREAATALLVAGIFGAHIASAQVNCTEGCVTISNNHTYLKCPDRVLTSQSDADYWGICANFTGNVVVQSNNLTNITLNGLERIEYGSLIVANSRQLTEILAPDLIYTNGNITLSNLPLLTTLQCPRLEYVGETLLWDSLPVLTDVDFGSLAAGDGYYSYGELNISNTSITDIAFYTHHYTEINSIELKDNEQLSLINLSSVLSCNNIDIARNSPSAIVLLTNFTYGVNVSLSNIAEVDLPALENLESGNLLLSNNSFETFLVPNLNFVGSLHIIDNPQLATIKFPNLQQIGGFGTPSGDMVVTGNPLLQGIVMNQVLWIDGSVVLTGNLSTVAMASFHNPLDQFYLNSTSPSLNCTQFDKLNYDYLSYEAETEANHTLPIPNNYTCSAYPPGSRKDVALHYRPPQKSPWQKMSKAERIVVVIASVVVGWIVLMVAHRYWRRKHPKPDPAPRAGVGGGGVGLADLTGGVVREEDDAAHRPPQYRRVGKPHEVPPGYTVDLNEVRSSEVEREEVNAPPVYTGTHTGRESLWNRIQVAWVNR